MANEKGNVTLSAAGESATVASANSAPVKVGVMGQEEMRETFGAALAAEPPPSVVYTLYFQKDSNELDAPSTARLQSMVREVVKSGSRDISINGHTDTTGDVEYNLRLSLQRATSVRDLLVKAGIKPDYMSVDSHGKGNPLIPTGDNVNEPRNRRVEVIVR
ncbi:MAG TPA: OmpA family protein [Geobacteraceae bacterium]